MVLPTLSKDVDLAEEAQAGPTLVAMTQQPTDATIPGIMQQDMINSNNQTTQPEQKDGLEQKQEQQLTNIDPQAISRGINLLNKYYPGLGQVTFQPVLQLLPANPLMARQWADVSQDFSQNQTSQTSRFYDANNTTQINDVAKLEENSSKNSNKTQKSKTDLQQAPSSSAAALSTENNGQNKNRIYSNSSHAEVKGPKNKAQKHTEEKSNDAKLNKDFKQHGGWSLSYQRHMECVNDYKLYGGLAPQVAYDAIRIALVIRGGYPLYQGATISTILTKKWLTKSLKFLRRKFPQAAATKAGTYLIENYTNFPEYIINKGEDLGIEIGNKICQ